jgi:hypothetical protein
MKEQNYKPIAIIGNPDTGKTTLMLHLMNESGFDKKYILGYPEKIDGFGKLSDLRDLSRVSDCVVGIDEIDEIIPMYEKRANDALKRVLKFAYHNRIKLIINTQLSQFVSKMMAALIPQWAITEIDIFELKNGSKPKRILIDYLKIPEVVSKEVGMKLKRGCYVWYNDQAIPGENGVYSFPDMHIKKAWGNESAREKQAELKEVEKSLQKIAKNPE